MDERECALVQRLGVDVLGQAVVSKASVLFQAIHMAHAKLLSKTEVQAKADEMESVYLELNSREAALASVEKVLD